MSKWEVFFDENIDGNVKFKYIYIIIDEKALNLFTQNGPNIGPHGLQEFCIILMNYEWT